MNQDNVFQYTYSAPQNQEVLSIRKKYLPQEETKLEELKRLDQTVQSAGTVEALCAGIGGSLVFGLGMCFSMKIIGDMLWLGIALGLVGMAGMACAYPLNRKYHNKAKHIHTPRILELTAELSGGME